MRTRRRTHRAGRRTDRADSRHPPARTRRGALVALGALLLGSAGMLLRPTGAVAGGGQWLPIRPVAADVRQADAESDPATAVHGARRQGGGGSPLDGAGRTGAEGGSGGGIGAWLSQAIAATALVLGLAWLWRLHRWTPAAGDPERRRRPRRRVAAPSGDMSRRGDGR